MHLIGSYILPGVKFLILFVALKGDNVLMMNAAHQDLANTYLQAYSSFPWNEIILFISY